VIRNRAKRRLRALARAVFPDLGQNGWDYVLVGRPAATVSADFAAMQADLRSALARVHRPATRK
jgi:ribonuclease P protein component